MARPPLKLKISHPGRLTNAAKASGMSIDQKAREWARSGDKGQMAAANLYLNVLKR